VEEADRQHPARSASTVIKQVRAGLQIVADRQKHQLGHQFHDFTWREVFPGFLVVFLVELANQLLEDVAHAVIAESR
jgi:hypothetical protein